MFFSAVADHGAVSLPDFSGVRIMMMPFDMSVLTSIPYPVYRPLLDRMLDVCGVRNGIGYLTIDEAVVDGGQTHRRPGLHVDGVGPSGEAGGWGGPPPGGWGAGGMLVCASVLGSRAWHQEFEGAPRSNGDCEHLRPQLQDSAVVELSAGRLWGLQPNTVHESLVHTSTTRRTFVRLSLPSDAPWYENYTPNPWGIKPTGPIHPPRAEMNYRP